MAELHIGLTEGVLNQPLIGKEEKFQVQADLSRRTGIHLLQCIFGQRSFESFSYNPSRTHIILGRSYQFFCFAVIAVNVGSLFFLPGNLWQELFSFPSIFMYTIPSWWFAWFFVFAIWYARTNNMDKLLAALFPMISESYSLQITTPSNPQDNVHTSGFGVAETVEKKASKFKIPLFRRTSLVSAFSFVGCSVGLLVFFILTSTQLVFIQVVFWENQTPRSIIYSIILVVLVQGCFGVGCGVYAVVCWCLYSAGNALGYSLVTRKISLLQAMQQHQAIRRLALSASHKLSYGFVSASVVLLACSLTTLSGVVSEKVQGDQSSNSTFVTGQNSAVVVFAICQFFIVLGIQVPGALVTTKFHSFRSLAASFLAEGYGEENSRSIEQFLRYLEASPTGFLMGPILVDMNLLAKICYSAITLIGVVIKMKF